MKYGEIYQIFQKAGYKIEMDPFDNNCKDWIDYDSEYIYINEIQFLNCGYIQLSRTELIIKTTHPYLDYWTTVNLGIKLEDVDSLAVGTRWWDENE